MTETGPPTAGRPYDVRLSYAGVFGKAPVPLRVYRYLRGSLRAPRAGQADGHRLVHLHFFSIGFLEVFNLLVARLWGMSTVVTMHDIEVLGGSESPRLLRTLAYRLTPTR